MLRVFVADPDPDDAKTLAYLLRLWGYSVHTAADGPSLIRAAQTDPADVVILSADLPPLDARATLNVLREALPGRLLLIALTKGSLPAAGFDHCLQKPVDVCDLRRLLREFGGS
jgi:CheY-like chemotaxis protein